MKISKYLPFAVITLVVLSISSFLFIKKFNTYAQSSVTKTFTTTVTVGNSAPQITVAPAENPISSTSTPTSPGTAISFSATATDSNGENYYLVICSSDSVTPGTSGGAPTCGGTQYCVSSSTASGDIASCSYATKATDPYTNEWFAFVCDANTTLSACSGSSQGSGDSGSPFIVNHAPTFTAISNNSPRDPGTSVTWTATASDTTDGNTVKLLVCKTQAMADGVCTGGSWCTSSSVASNPTCSYSIPVPTADGANNAYVYIVDQFNTAATGTTQGSNSPFTVNNVAPTVSNVTLNGGSAINLEAGTTKSVPVTATITDNNGCTSPEISSAVAYVYRSAITYTGCDTSGEGDPNYCYPEIACSAGTCSGTNVTYTCSVPMQYYADPTDANNVATSFATQNWLATVKATDNNNASGNTTIGTGVEVNSLAAFNITSAIDYGNLGAGETSSSLDKEVRTTPTGNVPLDQTHLGSQMCTNYPTCTGGTPIAVNRQRYSLTQGASYSSGTALSATATDVNLNVPKVTSSTVATRSTWWGISIDLGTLPGVYNGVNTITSKIVTTP